MKSLEALKTQNNGIKLLIIVQQSSKLYENRKKFWIFNKKKKKNMKIEIESWAKIPITTAPESIR